MDATRKAEYAHKYWARKRAEIRAGELLNEMKERGEHDDGKGNRNPDLKSQAAPPGPKLKSEIGLSGNRISPRKTCRARSRLNV